MIEKELLGEVTIKIDGFDTSLMSEKLYKSCKVISLYTKFDSVYLTTLGTHERRVYELCDKCSCLCETISRNGAVFAAKKYVKRFGFYFGAAAIAALIFIFSNTVMKVKIVGTDDPELQQEIRALLREEGVHGGSYIPSLNYLELSAKLFVTNEKISWVSMGNIGSVVYVNVYENTPKTSVENMRIPSNIVSERDAVIVNAEVRVGLLEVLIGDAVCKGQILVSGIVEHRSGLAKYYHSYAKIIGRYEETVEFQQKFTENSTYSGEKIYCRSLNFFELELPFPQKKPKSDTRYSERSSYKPVKLFGFTLPFGVTDYEYTELLEDVKTYTEAEAFAAAYKKADNYENNILADVTIVDKSVTETQTDEGVVVSIKYVIEGEIGKASPIYIR